jgi:TRAP transporter TAXI family solute receptor
MFRISFIILTLLLLAGCAQGPDGENLKKEIQTKLDQRFVSGLLKITELSRMGSYPFSDKQDSRERLLVYYKANATFQKDYNWSEWNKLNLASLASVFGATPLGVKGINQDGNKKGDVIKVYGTSTYIKDNNKWVASQRIFTQPKQTKQKKPLLDEKSYSEKSLTALSKKITALKKKGKSKILSAIDREMHTAMTNINLKIDRYENRISFLSGISSGEYYAFGNGLQKAFDSLKSPFRSYRTAGSRNNCKLVNSHSADFGIAQNDIAYMAVNGHKYFEDMPKLQNLRAVCSLFPEAIQILVLRSSNIKSIDDLKGKKLSIGRKGSGVFINALQILKGHGIEEGNFSKINHKSIPEALDALKSETIDAFFTTMAMPVPFIEEIASTTKIRLLPISETKRQSLIKEFPFFVPITIPKNTYIGQDGDVSTLGVTAMIITHKNTKGEKVQRLLENLFKQKKLIGQESTQANIVSKKQAKSGISITPHKAALEFLGKE